MIACFETRLPARAGLSIIEVLFALGIAIFGLLGIATLLPLAGRNAGDSLRMAESQALAHRWYDDLVVTGATNSANWIYYRDFQVAAFPPAYESYGSLPTRHNAYSTGTRYLTRQAVCIDPFFMSSRDIQPQLASHNFDEPTSGAPPAPHRWYRPTMFPYYLDSYNPVVDPAYTYGSQSGFALADQPRMVRVTLGTISPGGVIQTISHRATQALLGSQDDLATDINSSDASSPPTRTPLISSGTRIDTMQAKNDYSWLATICPNDTLLTDMPVSSAILSVAVIYKRDLLFFSTRSPPNRSGEPEPESKPQGELQFCVVPQYHPLSGGGLAPASFSGGHGGTVTLVASDGISNRIRAGDWIMLSKNRVATGTTTAPVFRWFRIAAVEGEAEYATSANVWRLGPSPDEVWGRRVVLDGPDWVFDAPDAPGGQPTMATYIPGTVAVYERMIPW